MATGVTRNADMAMMSKAAVAEEAMAVMDVAGTDELNEVEVPQATQMKRAVGNGLDAGSDNQQMDELQVRENLNETATEM